MREILRRIFLENLWLKLISLALSCVLFLYVQGERSRERIATGALVKLVLKLPPGKVLTVNPVDKIAVNLRGPRSAIKQLMAEGIDPLEIDLSTRAPGPLHFTSDMIRVPRGLFVESIQPPQIDLSWEVALTKSIPLNPRISGRPASGYRVAEVTATPQEATVTGPKSTVSGVPSLELREVGVDGRTESAVLTVPIQVNLKYVTVSPRFGRVAVKIIAETITRSFSEVDVSVLNLPKELEVKVTPPRVKTIVIEGPAPLLSRMVSTDLHAEIDVGRRGKPLKPGSYLRRVTIRELPRGVRVRTITPARFALKVRQKVQPKPPGPVEP